MQVAGSASLREAVCLPSPQLGGTNVRRDLSLLHRMGCEQGEGFKKGRVCWCLSSISLFHFISTLGFFTQTSWGVHEGEPRPSLPPARPPEQMSGGWLQGLCPVYPQGNRLSLFSQTLSVWDVGSFRCYRWVPCELERGPNSIPAFLSSRKCPPFTCHWPLPGVSRAIQGRTKTRGIDSPTWWLQNTTKCACKSLKTFIFSSLSSSV